jgi:hypothetical protein
MAHNAAASEIPGLSHRRDAEPRVPHDKLRQDPKWGRCRTPLFQGKPVALTAASLAREQRAAAGDRFLG